MTAREKSKLRRMNQRWGNWEYDPETFVLRHGPGDYEVDLDDCATAGQVLDWIMQVAGKGSIFVRDVRDLLEALREILDVQRSICPSGDNRTISPRRVAASRGFPVPEVVEG